jgi:hypothetical protein
MIEIYGHSDDVVVIEGDFGHDETTANKMITIGNQDKGVKITMKYAASKKSGAVWRAGIEQIDEGVPMFPMTIGLANPSGYPEPLSYSVKVSVDCPKDTLVMVGKKSLS